MTIDRFLQSLTGAEPPAALAPALAGLWWDAKGDWMRAYESAQQDEGKDGSCVGRCSAYPGLSSRHVLTQHHRAASLSGHHTVVVVGNRNARSGVHAKYES